MTFKPGDRVRCVDHGDYLGHSLHNGQEYEVDGIKKDDPLQIHLKGFGRDCYYFTSRFELVQPAVDIDAICRGEWPAGTRVRCVDARDVDLYLTVGREYVVERRTKLYVYLQAHDRDIRGFRGGMLPQRFKPVVRVRMNSY